MHLTKIHKAIGALTLFGVSQATLATRDDSTPASLIPWPSQITFTQGDFTLNENTPLCGNTDTDEVLPHLQAVMLGVQGIALNNRSCSGKGISFERVAGEDDSKPESYSLSVTKDGIKIKASEDAGLFYGAMTLAQLASSNNNFGSDAVIHAVEIQDSPEFAWRGLMLDPSRHFLPMENVKIIVDQMAQLKLNRLHLHLSDDQGWRVEIKKYPKLTEIGGWRSPPSNGDPSSTKGKYGGFYTQQQIKDLVRYAADRQITIIPEIDLPGHAQAAVAAYPEILGVTGDRPKVSADWGINPYLFNTSDESLEFVKNVLDEIMMLFPGEYIHLGGDEAVKDQWENSDDIQAQMKSLGVEDAHQMQSWFMTELGNYLAQHGRKMVGWDEILDGGIPESATVMSWRGPSGAVSAARMGHDVVQSLFYLDNLQSRRSDEPAGRLGILPLSKIYKSDIVPSVLNAEETHHILGAQGHLWSEYLLSPWYVERAAFPRSAAIAEILWSRPADRNWSSFLQRLPEQMQRYADQDIAAADSAFAINFGLKGGRNQMLRKESGELLLGNQVSFGDIHYTTDGSVPNIESPLYSHSISVHFGDVITATAFNEGGMALASPRKYEVSKAALNTRVTNELRPCYGGDFGLRVPLTADSPATSPVYDVDIFHNCFVYPAADMTEIQQLEISKARLARNYGLAHEADKVKSYPKNTEFGELVVYLDKCESGEEIARKVLPDPASSSNQQTLTFSLPREIEGEHDLCMVFNSSIHGPLHAISSVELKP